MSSKMGSRTLVWWWMRLSPRPATILISLLHRCLSHPSVLVSHCQWTNGQPQGWVRLMSSPSAELPVSSLSVRGYRADIWKPVIMNCGYYMTGWSWIDSIWMNHWLIKADRFMATIRDLACSFMLFFLWLLSLAIELTSAMNKRLVIRSQAEGSVMLFQAEFNITSVPTLPVTIKKNSGVTVMSFLLHLC